MSTDGRTDEPKTIVPFDLRRGTKTEKKKKTAPDVCFLIYLDMVNSNRNISYQYDHAQTKQGFCFRSGSDAPFSCELQESSVV